jgi:hypothetical protein
MGFPTSEEFVRRAEESLAIMLPAAVRARLLQENGGEIEADGDVWELFPVEDSTDRKRISRTANHIVRETEEARQWPEFPATAVAIAANGTGDYLILQPARQASGQLLDEVFLWDHETGGVTPVDVTWSL